MSRQRSESVGIARNFWVAPVSTLVRGFFRINIASDSVLSIFISFSGAEEDNDFLFGEAEEFGRFSGGTEHTVGLSAFGLLGIRDTRARYAVRGVITRLDVSLAAFRDCGVSAWLRVFGSVSLPEEWSPF